MSGTSTSRAFALPSLGTALAGATATLRRFPTVLIAAAVASAAAICSSEDLGPQAIQLRLLATAALGLPLLTAVTVAGERRARGPRLALHALALLVLAAFYAAWPGWTGDGRALHFTQLLAAFALLLAVLPFARSAAQNAFWQYNRVLLVRLVIAGVAAFTAYSGLALALLAADKLFGVDVPGAGYFRIFAVIMFVFAPWFFLGDVPEDLEALEQVRDYPAVLRVFAQYILTPLVAMYLVILTLYLVKVVALWDWPSGWIGWLVSGVACAGILALLLVHPIAERPDQKWIAAFARDFWIAILPAIVMLWLAIWQRVHQYGITEPRYFLILLSLWLAGSALYFRLARQPRITAIPASLCVLAVLSLAGPWGAYSVSRASQEARLSGLLERRGILVGGRITPARGALAAPDAKEISAGVRYLVRSHGVAAVRWLVPDSVRLFPVADDESAEPTVRRVVEAMGVPYVEPGARGAAGRRFSLRAADSPAPVSLAGFDVMLPVRRPGEATRDTGLVASWTVEGTVRVSRGAETIAVIPLDSLVARGRKLAARRSYVELPPALLRADVPGGRVRARAMLQQVEGNVDAGRVRLTDARGYVLVGLRR